MTNEFTEAPDQRFMHMRRRRKMKMFSLMAACAAVVVISVGAWSAISQSYVDSVIEIDVNPSVELSTNSKEKVIEARALNADAEKVLDGMNLKDVDLDIAVNALIGSMLKHGYVSELKNSVLVSVENGDVGKRAKLEKKLSDDIGILLSANSVDGAVLSQAIGGDPELKELSAKYSISVGKAALVRSLIKSDTRLRFEDVAPLSINDINLLVDSRKSAVQGVKARGKASDGIYIGEDKAKETVFSDAGAIPDKVTQLETSMELDGGVMVYEIDFRYNNAEYEYEVDAGTGRIIVKESEMENKAPTGESADTHYENDDDNDESDEDSDDD
jgi:hypothetical protein